MFANQGVNLEFQAILHDLFQCLSALLQVAEGGEHYRQIPVRQHLCLNFLSKST